MGWRGEGRERATLASGLVDVVEFGDLREAVGVAHGFADARGGEEFDVGHCLWRLFVREDHGKRGSFAGGVCEKGGEGCGRMSCGWEDMKSGVVVLMKRGACMGLNPIFIEGKGE